MPPPSLLDMFRQELGKKKKMKDPFRRTLGGDGVRRRREPDVRDAGGGDVVDLPHQEVVPPAALLARLPVERLRHGAQFFQTRIPCKSTGKILPAESFLQSRMI